MHINAGNWYCSIKCAQGNEQRVYFVCDIGFIVFVHILEIIYIIDSLYGLIAITHMTRGEKWNALTVNGIVGNWKKMYNFIPFVLNSKIG